MTTQDIDSALVHALFHPAGILAADANAWIEINAALKNLIEQDDLAFEKFQVALFEQRKTPSELEFLNYFWRITPVPGFDNLWLVQTWPNIEILDQLLVPLHQEVFHRVKNNLAMIESLLYLQKMLTKDEVICSILDDCEKRIHSMILVHVNLCHNLETDVVNMPQYLEQLIRYLINSFGSFGAYNIKTSYADIDLPSDKAVAIGLIVNELVTNSFKYGLKNTYNPTLEIRFEETPTGLKLVVADNGPGFEKLPGNEDNKSLGLMLVKMLCRDLNGKFELVNKNGASASVVFQHS
jgi:two-component sensor histidine kinase